MNAIETHNLSLWYGAFQALRDVTLSVQQCGITALIGPSGCGKTTLLLPRLAAARAIPLQ